MKRHCVLTMAVTVTAGLLLGGCRAKPIDVEEELFAMDTFCRIEAHGDDAGEAVQAAKGELLRLEDMFSIGQDTSDTVRINAAGARPVVISEDTASLIRTAAQVSEQTNGAFDITIEPVVRLWGFYDEVQQVPDENALTAALKYTDYTQIQLKGNRLRLNAEGGVDLGGIAKGYAAQSMSYLMAAYELEGALISLGGNVQVFGEREGGGIWKIGVQDPTDESQILCVLPLTDCAVVTAGAYQRYFVENGVRYHHILDPHTGWPAQSGLLSVTVVAKNGARADALSTAIFVMGAEQAMALYQSSQDFDMLLVSSNGLVSYTAGLNPVSRSSGYQFVEIVE